MQASLDAEAKGKAEAIRQKKGVEQALSQAELAVDQANRANGDLQKVNKRLQQTIAEYQATLEEEQRQRNEARELVAGAERSTNSLLAEIDQKQYPETLGKMFIINVPSVFPFVWRMVKPMLVIIIIVITIII